MYTTFISKETVCCEFANSAVRLKEKLDKVDIALTENLFPIQKNSYHFVTRILKPEHRYDRILFAHIFKTALQTELLSAGSSFLTVYSSIGFIELLSRNESLVQKNEYETMEAYHREAGKILELVQSNCTKVTPSLLDQLVYQTCEDVVLSAAVSEAVQLAGMEGNIHVEDSQQSGFGVELRHGYSFHVSPYKMFLSSFGSWEVYNAKVVCVDGIIEKVSELDKLLLRASETKIPVVLIAQGFSEEIVATIKTNNLRNIFNILPVRLEQSLDNLNILNDIATVSGVDVVSVLKGDMLLYMDFDSIPLVEHVKCTEDEIVIRNSITRAAVGSQIKMLLDKKSKQTGVEMIDIGNMLEKRIGNLLSHSVVIRLPNYSKGQRENAKMKVDIALRTVKTVLTYGIIKKVTLLEELSLLTPETIMGQIVREVLVGVVGRWDREYLPTLSIYAGFFFAGQTVLSLMSSSGVVLVDKD